MLRVFYWKHDCIGIRRGLRQPVTDRRRHVVAHIEADSKTLVEPDPDSCACVEGKLHFVLDLTNTRAAGVDGFAYCVPVDVYPHRAQPRGQEEVRLAAHETLGIVENVGGTPRKSGW